MTLINFLFSANVVFAFINLGTSIAVGGGVLNLGAGVGSAIVATVLYFSQEED